MVSLPPPTPCVSSSCVCPTCSPLPPPGSSTPPIVLHAQSLLTTSSYLDSYNTLLNNLDDVDELGLWILAYSGYMAGEAEREGKGDEDGANVSIQI